MPSELGAKESAHARVFLEISFQWGVCVPSLSWQAITFFVQKFKLKRKERCCVFGFSLGLR
jgi:hypothetical protein